MNTHKIGRAFRLERKEPINISMWAFIVFFYEPRSRHLVQL